LDKENISLEFDKDFLGLCSELGLESPVVAADGSDSDFSASDLFSEEDSGPTLLLICLSSSLLEFLSPTFSASGFSDLSI